MSSKPSDIPSPVGGGLGRGHDGQSPGHGPLPSSPLKGEGLKIQFIDLAAQQRRIKPQLDAAIARVLAHGGYIMGKEVGEFEKQLCAFTGAKYALSCSNGTDAITLALMAYNVQAGDAVFCPSFTFAATAEVVALRGATPVFVDSLPDTFNMDPKSLEAAITVATQNGLRPRGVIPVCLFGQPPVYAEIKKIAQAHGLFLIGDCAQGFGGEINGQQVPNLADITTTSFFPAKPLGCYGDGGAVFTDNKELYDIMVSLRVHGKGTDKYDNVRVGLNARLDTLQAAILIEKLAIFPDEILARNRIAARYTQGLNDVITTPHVPAGYTSVWAQYTLLAKNETARDSIVAALKTAGIPTMVYYPKPLHQQTAYKTYPTATGGALPICEGLALRVFSLPMHPYLDEATMDYIIGKLRDVLARQ